MDQETGGPGSAGGGASPESGSRPVPMAAIAGAVILVGLVGFALYRRMSPAVSAPPGGPAQTAAPAPAADPNQPAQAGTEISAKPPFRLSPEASILAERYRCVCGCNDTLSVCTCRNPKGSEEMKQTLQALADQRKSPEEADAVMQQTYGPAALLKNPAPPQTLPSMAGPPPAPPAPPAHSRKHP